MTLQLLINGTDYTARWRLYESRWSSKAWLGESVQGDFLLDDFDGAVSHDDLKPRKIVEVWEDASGSPVCLYHGRIANKTLGMGPPNYRIAMQWHVLTEDFNIELRGLRVESQTRGNETDDERVEFFRLGWLNGVASTNSNARASTELGGAYIGVTPANAVDLDPEQYVDTFPADVFQRIAEMSGRQFFVYLEDDGTGELFYDNRGSQSIVADIDITDDGETDGADGVDVFAAYKTPNAGDHAGQEVYTGGAIRYGDEGTYFEASDVGGSESEYDKWETTWSNDWVENDAQASVVLGRIITNHDETISYAATIDMRPEDAHRIKAGMWIPSVRLRRANKNGTDGIRAVTVTHEPVKPNADGESWYRVTIEMGRPQFSGPMPRGRRRIPRPPAQPSAGGCTRLYFSTDNVGTTIATDATAWSDADTVTLGALHTTADGTYGGSARWTWSAVNAPAANYIGTGRAWGYQITDASLLADVQAGGLAFEAHLRSGSRYGIGINEASQNNRAQRVVRIWRSSGGGSFIGTALAADGSPSGLPFPAQAVTVNREYSGTLSAVGGAALNDWIIIEIGTAHITPTSGGTGSSHYVTSDSATDLPDDELETAAYNSWIDLCSTGSGTSGPGPGTLPGDETWGDPDDPDDAGCYSPCGHQHAHGFLADDGTHLHDADQIAGLTDPPSLEGFVKTDFGGQHVLNTVSSSGSATTLDLQDGNVHDVTLDDDVTFTFDGATSGVGSFFWLIMRQDDTGSRVPTFPSSVVWPDDTEPTWSTDPAAVDIVEFFSVDGGTTWHGDAGGGSSGVVLSDDTPLVESGAGDPGVADEASRSDHVHPAAAGGGGIPNAILLESGHAVPFTFDDILQASDGSDFLWASE